MLNCSFDNSGSTLCCGGACGVTVLEIPAMFAAPPPSQSTAGTRATAASFGGSADKYALRLVRKEHDRLSAVRLATQLQSTPLLACVGGAFSRGAFSDNGTTATSSSPPVFSDGISSHKSVGSDRCVTLFDLETPQFLAELHFDTAVLNILLNTMRMIVVLEKSVHVFCLSNLKHIASVRTIAPLNKAGIGDLSCVTAAGGRCFFAYPQSPSITSETASKSGCSTAVQFDSPGEVRGAAGRTDTTSSGDVILLDAMDVVPLLTIAAHRHPIQLLRFSPSGSMLATCSVVGTNIHVYGVPNGVQLFRLRRGHISATIRALQFNPTGELVVAASDSGTIHLFYCGSPTSLFAGVSSLASTNRRALLPPAASKQILAATSSQVSAEDLKEGRLSAATAMALGDAGGIRSFGRINVPSFASGGKCSGAVVCSFSEDSRVLSVVVPQGSSSESMDHAGGGSAAVLVQYSVDRECRLLRDFTIDTTQF